MLDSLIQQNEECSFLQKETNVGFDDIEVFSDFESAFCAGASQRTPNVYMLIQFRNPYFDTDQKLGWTELNDTQIVKHYRVSLNPLATLEDMCSLE